MSKKPLYDRPFLWGIVIASFALAILDMIFLKGVFENYVDGFDDIMGAFVALALATTANLSALMWGRQRGRKKSGASFFLAWVFLGIVYAALRGVSIYINIIEGEELDFETIMGEAIPALILTISYIGTGTMLEWAGAQLWDIDVTNYLKYKKAFTKENALLSNNSADIKKTIKSLNEYQKNYDSLNEQYKQQKKMIAQNKQETLSQIVGKTIADHEINPAAANRVLKEVLSEKG